MAESMTSGTTTTSAAVQRKSRHRMLRRVALAMVILVAAIPLGLWAWGVWEARGLGRRIDALRQAGEPVTVADLAPALALPEDQNPAVAFRAAADAIDSESQAWTAYAGLLEFPPPLFEKERAILRAAVAENGKALSLAEAAAGRVSADGRANWGVTIGSPMLAEAEERLPFIRSQRRLQELLLADGVLAVDEGDLPRALCRGQQMAAQGRAVAHHPSDLATWVAMGMMAGDGGMAMSVARALAASGAEPSDELRRQAVDVIRQLLDDASLRRGMIDMLRKERVMQLDTIAAAAEGRLPPGLLGKNHERAVLRAGWSRGWTKRNAAAVLDEFAVVIDAARQTHDLPAFEAQVATRPSAIDESPRLYALAHAMTAARALPKQYYLAITSRHMDAALLAVALYKADHDGRLPRTLSELVPEYLPAVPLDLRAGGGTPIGYVPAPNRPYVYNAGENGRDDGGRRRSTTAPWQTDREVVDEVLDLVPEPREESEDEITWEESGAGDEPE